MTIHTPTPSDPAAAVRAGTRAAAQSAAALLALRAAFRSDPPVRWLYPDEAAYDAHFDGFARTLCAPSLDARSFVSAEGGAALWIRPGAAPDDLALVETVERTLPAERRDDVLSVFEAMGEAHPEEPHWYLPMIGVEPRAQGAGLGTALMAPVLARCDAEGVPAYLEATTRRSAALYARLGFEVSAPLEVAGCPALLPMTRRPRGGRVR